MYGITGRHADRIQADQYTTGEEAAAKKASRSFKKYSYRGVELDQLLDMSNEKFIDVSLSCSPSAQVSMSLTMFFPIFPCTRINHFALFACLNPFYSDPVIQLVHARARRRFQRGLKRKPLGLIKKLRQAKKDAAANEKPAMVKTHLRDMIIVPEMIGSVVGVYVSPFSCKGYSAEVLTRCRTESLSPLSRSSQR